MRLLHYGYQSGANKEKMSRNISILRRWVEREPNTIYGNFKLGMNLCHQGGISEGLYFLGHSFSLLGKEANINSYPFARQLVGEYYKNLMESGKAERAEEVKREIANW